MIAALFGSGCRTEPEDALADLYGKWVSDVVTISGVGYFDGTATHNFGDDGSYRWEIDFADPNAGCQITLYYAGTFTGDETTLELTPTEGEVEVNSCDDEASNAPNRAFGEEEIAAAASSSEWLIEDDTLKIIHEDGLDRVYHRP